MLQSLGTTALGKYSPRQKLGTWVLCPRNLFFSLPTLPTKTKQPHVTSVWCFCQWFVGSWIPVEGVNGCVFQNPTVSSSSLLVSQSYCVKTGTQKILIRSLILATLDIKLAAQRLSDGSKPSVPFSGINSPRKRILPKELMSFLLSSGQRIVVVITLDL